MSDEEDVDERLQSLETKVTECTNRCAYQSAQHLSKELRRFAKGEQRVVPYLYAGFYLMTNASDLLDPDLVRDTAIELIGLLESEDQARAIEPDLPEAEYYQTVHWMTACAYDNLAQATAMLHGYNSEGMHQCITEGIHVCRRTGKLECIRCFREYATDVYLAADDLDLAMQFARMGIAHEKAGGHDRRWVGAKDLANLLLLQGDLEGAAEAAEQAWKLSDTFHNPRSASLQTHLILRTICALMGAPDEIRAFDCTADGRPFDAEVPKGEYPYYEMKRDQVAAIEACCKNQMDPAFELVTRWDRVLRDKRCLHYWVQNRLLLVAFHRFAGNDQQVRTIGAELRKKAEESRDWLTLRCLARLENETDRPLPVPALADFNAGPFATGTRVVDLPFHESSGEVVSEAASATPSTADSKSVEPSRPELPPRAAALRARVGEAHRAYVESNNETEYQAARADILRDFVAIDPATVVDPWEARALLHTAQFVLVDDVVGQSVWRWAEAIATHHSRDASVLGNLATLGAALRFRQNSDCTELISEKHLEALFRQSLDLDPQNARNFGLAGKYFQFVEHQGEAERCYARGFRLDRTDSQLALPLANIYQRTDRQREGLFVLDLAIREGCDAPDVSWRAALAAFHLQQHEAVISYLDRYEGQVPGNPWVNYYRAAALLELNRPSEALIANDEEKRRNPDCPYHTLVYQACALAMLGRKEEFRDTLTQLLDMRLVEIDYLSPRALGYLFEHLWNSVAGLPPDDALRKRFEGLILSAGFAPDEMFYRHRKAADGEAIDVNYYECTLTQPLDDRWPTWPGCRQGEESWTSYQVRWGVLARTPEDAERTVLQWQMRCFPVPASQIEVEPSDEHYRDKPGVVWQGERYEASEGEE